MPDKATIKIPKTLYASLKQQIKETGFTSVTDFIVYVMRDIVASGSMREDAALSKNELAQVRKRLKALGYI